MLLLIQVVCESSHATSFVVGCTTSSCSSCLGAPVGFFAFDTKISTAGGTWIVIFISACIHLANFHALDCRDWVPPRLNVDTYFRPPRPRRRNRSVLAAFRRFLRNHLAPSSSEQPATAHPRQVSSRWRHRTNVVTVFISPCTLCSVRECAGEDGCTQNKRKTIKKSQKEKQDKQTHCLSSS